MITSNRTSVRARVAALLLATTAFAGLGVAVAGPASAMDSGNHYCGWSRVNCEEDARNYRLAGYSVSPIYYTDDATGIGGGWNGYWFQYWSA